MCDLIFNPKSLSEVNVNAWPQSVFPLMSGVFGVCYSPGHMDASVHDTPVKKKTTKKHC